MTYCSVQVGTCLLMYRYILRFFRDKVRYIPIRIFYHQVNIVWRGFYPVQTFHDIRSESYIRNKVPVHDVNVKIIRTRLRNAFGTFSEFRKIR